MRCVLTVDGRAVVDAAGAGRGAWLCVPPEACFQLARRRRAFDRAWRRAATPGALDELARQLATVALDAAAVVT